MAVTYVKPQHLELRQHPTLDEKWVHDRIAEDPSILGLGELVLKDRERRQPNAGRLDLLLQDSESERRYEVELQLGKTDESHIIRTLEYWDIERKRYPQYEHAAVIIAEEITGRFLNVIGLFNGSVPLIAIRMQAVQLGESVSLIFTTVLNELQLGLVDEDEETTETVDRSYWEKRSSKSMLELADSVFDLIRELDPHLAPTYRAPYIGVSKNGSPRNFIVIKPKKDWMWIEPRMERDPDLESRLENAGIEVADYRARWNRYRIRLDKDNFRTAQVEIREVIKRSFDRAFE